MRVPRSQFYARAVEVYLRQASGQDVTERLSAVYQDPPQKPDPFPATAARAALRRTRW
jgi:hypothetical protein